MLTGVNMTYKPTYFKTSFKLHPQHRAAAATPTFSSSAATQFHCCDGIQIPWCHHKHQCLPWLFFFLSHPKSSSLSPAIAALTTVAMVTEEQACHMGIWRQVGVKTPMLLELYCWECTRVCLYFWLKILHFYNRSVTEASESLSEATHCDNSWQIQIWRNTPSKFDISPLLILKARGKLSERNGNWGT